MIDFAAVLRSARRAAFVVSSLTLLGFHKMAFAAHPVLPTDEEILMPPAPPYHPGDAQMMCSFFAFVSVFFLWGVANAIARVRKLPAPSADGQSVANSEDAAAAKEKLALMSIGFLMCLFGAIWAGVRA